MIRGERRKVCANKLINEINKKYQNSSKDEIRNRLSEIKQKEYNSIDLTEYEILEKNLLFNKLLDNNQRTDLLVKQIEEENEKIDKIVFKLVDK